MTEEMVTIRWSFRYYRRHMPGEVVGVLAYLAEQRPEMLASFGELVSSAGHGLCNVKCLGCGKHIFGDQALGGIVIIEPDKPLQEDRIVNFISPLCVPCAKCDMDIIQTRCLAAVVKDISHVFHGAKMEVLPWAGDELSTPGALK